MKPSERINELYFNVVDEKMIPQEYRNLALLNAILDYLDEEWEKKHKAELEIIKNKLNGELDERSMMDGAIYLSDAKLAVNSILDKHINK